MKANKKAAMKSNLLDLDASVGTLKEHSDVSLDWKSPIHLRMVVDGKWTDFWPTTGRWYDFTSGEKGTGVEAMMACVSKRIDTRPFVLSHVPQPPAEAKPSKEKQTPILNRLETISKRARAAGSGAQPEAPSAALHDTLDPATASDPDSAPW